MLIKYAEENNLLGHPYSKILNSPEFTEVDTLIERLMMVILHLQNKTWSNYFRRKQPMVETATYGHRFVTARTATGQVMDLRNTLNYLGDPIHSVSYLFDDTNMVVDFSSTSLSRLHN